MKLQILVFSVLMCLYSSASQSTERRPCAEFAPLTFGVLPFVSARRLVERFAPLANYLTQALASEVRLETAPDFVAFVQRTSEAHRYDILFTAPHFYSSASNAGYRLVARVDSPGMRALIVVPEHSEIKRVSDLPGKRMSTLDSKSLASLLVKKHLRENAIDPENDLTIIYTPTHNASLLSAYHGVTDAAALMRPPYEAASKKVRESMRIIAETERAPHMPISVAGKISQSCTADIRRVLLSMSLTAKGREVLKHNRFSGFSEAQAEEYESMKNLMQVINK
ncbi:MAG TPA: phosphate/phosphite/phosphonate ABC transporter substrate-binding protein [Gammaproteobacteria bacterium]|nr:phosphate/phosphite/phosphonate ABC transporter substrate-binding protein [Gammaproteobacteria bacterium]